MIGVVEDLQDRALPRSATMALSKSNYASAWREPETNSIGEMLGLPAASPSAFAAMVL
jgi:hypothetical protein